MHRLRNVWVKESVDMYNCQFVYEMCSIEVIKVTSQWFLLWFFNMMSICCDSKTVSE